MIVQSTGSERTTAAAVNISAIFCPYLGPIVGAVLAGKSKFVRFHAYRCLIEQILSTLIIGILVIFSLAFTIYSLSHTMQGGFDWHKIDWQTIVMKSVVTYLLLALWGVINTILSIRDAIEALGGHLPREAKMGRAQGDEAGEDRNQLGPADYSYLAIYSHLSFRLDVIC